LRLRKSWDFLSPEIPDFLPKIWARSPGKSGENPRDFLTLFSEVPAQKILGSRIPEIRILKLSAYAI